MVYGMVNISAQNQNESSKYSKSFTIVRAASLSSEFPGNTRFNKCLDDNLLNISFVRKQC